MTSYEQAEAEADERFYEERDDAEPLDGDVWDGLEREKGDDDGVEYADPRDEMEERRR